MLERLEMRHVVWIAVSILLAIALSFVPRVFSIFSTFNVLRGESATVAILFVFVLVFLMSNAIRKGQELQQNMNIELSRLRRIHHLVHLLGATAPDKKIQKDVTQGLKNYFTFLGRQSLSKYNEARDIFRTVTVSIYAFKPKSKRAELLYQELLSTTRELATTRQLVSSLLPRSISSFGWIVLFSIEVMVIFSILFSQGPDLVSQFISIATMASIFIVTLLIWEIDLLSPQELRMFGKKYLSNKESIDAWNQQFKI